MSFASLLLKSEFVILAFICDQILNIDACGKFQSISVNRETARTLPTYLAYLDMPTNLASHKYLDELKVLQYFRMCSFVVYVLCYRSCGRYSLYLVV